MEYILFRLFICRDMHGRLIPLSYENILPGRSRAQRVFQGRIHTSSPFTIWFTFDVFMRLARLKG